MWSRTAKTARATGSFYVKTAANRLGRYQETEYEGGKDTLKTDIGLALK